MSSHKVVGRLEYKLSRNILPAPWEIGQALRLKDLSRATSEQLVISMYKLAVRRDNWAWVEMAQEECASFFPKSWILEKIPSKARKLNQLSVSENKPYQNGVSSWPHQNGESSWPHDRCLHIPDWKLNVPEKRKFTQESHSASDNVQKMPGSPPCDNSNFKSIIEMDKPMPHVENHKLDQASGDVVKFYVNLDLDFKSTDDLKSPGDVMRTDELKSPGDDMRTDDSKRNDHFKSYDDLNSNLTGKKRKRIHKMSKCPMKDCTVLSRHIKRHVENTHLPILFYEEVDSQSDFIISKRVEALKMLGNWINKNSKRDNLSYLCTLVNKSEKIKDLMGLILSDKMKATMTKTCKYLKLKIPAEGFVMSPVNSPACLIQWKCLAILLNALTSEQKTIFTQKFGSIQVTLMDKLKKPAMTNAQSLTESQESGCVISIVVPDTSENTLTEETKSLIQTKDSSPMVCEEVETKEDVSIMETSSLVSDPSQFQDAIDCHIYLDRISQKLFRNGEHTPNLDEIITAEQPIKPRLKVNLKGVVSVYSDPEAMPVLPSDTRVKVAIGVHPCKIKLFTAERKKQFIQLMSNPRVTAMGEIGYDLLQPDWNSQLELLHQILPYHNIPQPIILHIRGNTASDINPYKRVFEIVQDYCGKAKPIHLHSFCGSSEDVKLWLDYFRNCYFGFTASVSSFSHIQKQGLNQVPLNRILLETDSPNLPPLMRQCTNTPAFVGEVGHLVATMREMKYPDLMRWAFENAKQLYNFSF